jgi:hypothetical protein
MGRRYVQMDSYALGDFDAESLHAGQEASLDFLPGNEEINVQELPDMARIEA